MLPYYQAEHDEQDDSLLNQTAQLNFTRGVQALISVSPPHFYLPALHNALINGSNLSAESLVDVVSPDDLLHNDGYTVLLAANLKRYDVLNTMAAQVSTHDIEQIINKGKYSNELVRQVLHDIVQDKKTRDQLLELTDHTVHNKTRKM